MEPFVGEYVSRGLVDAGVDVRVGVSVTALRRPGGTGPVTLELDDDSELEADELLFATGRAPLTGAAAIAARAAGQAVDTAPWGPHTTTAGGKAVPQVFFTGREVLRRRLHRSRPDDRRPRRRLPARRDLRRHRRQRAAALRNDRRGRAGPGRSAVARGALLPDHQ
jgi:dihydrolipoamide dehydrogenase